MKVLSLIVGLFVTLAVFSSCWSHSKIDISSTLTWIDDDTNFMHEPLTSSDAWSSLCNEEESPVCWSDGKTYINRCTAEKVEKVRVAYPWECTKIDNQVLSWTILSSWNTTSETQWTNSTFIENNPLGMSELPNEQEWRNSLEELEDSTLSPVQNPPPASNHEYVNTWFHYGYTLPKYSYYQWYWSRDWADNTMGVATSASGVESFDSAEVKIYYYKNVPMVPVAGTQVSLDNGGMLIIQKWENAGPKATEIEKMILSSARITQ